ncbi:hypothetical protein MKQ68_12565 [Chitinophaga horti]|uniref:PLAT domain-containing protein n=1 Tax=Chitinophaga horti TaxID=2920382 RepID=A0ABY6JCJ4_9BACT|nr:hypothetical protein [Chitinophaga horti]UYQ95934.1 hypothetical protein MKQ68_12565 [Chitinophaga horti]
MRQLFLVLAGVLCLTAASAQEKIYTGSGKAGTTHFTTYLRLHGDSGFVRTDFRQDGGHTDTTVTRGFYRVSGKFYQFVTQEPKFCLKRSGRKFYHCHITGGYEHGWFTWLLTRGKPLRLITPDAALRKHIR